MREILCYEHSTVPYALVHTDGTLRKTNKSLLLQILETYVTVEPRLPCHQDMPTFQILDAMGLVQSLRFARATTFGEMATKYFKVFTAHYDRYWQLSIKAGERQKRGEANALEVRIDGASTPVPKQFPKYISNTGNKVSLSAFLTEAWIEMAKQRLLVDKELVIGGGGTDGQLALSIKNGECTKVTALHCDHEEADTRMLPHAKHASRDAQRIG